jgi:hypothetical protein
MFDLIAFKDSDVIKIIGQYPSRHQPRDTPSHDYCMLTQTVHNYLLPNAQNWLT